MLLIENSAGGGGCVGADIAEIGSVLQGLGYPASLGMCLDTAHAFAAGYDLRSAEQVDELLASIDQSMSIARLRLMHLNDSKLHLGSGRDRHENIGGGYIGLTGFANILTRPDVRRLPLILETPRQERRLEELGLLKQAAALDLTQPRAILPIPSWESPEPQLVETA
jgi:deoxyribonuclease-4